MTLRPPLFAFDPLRVGEKHVDPLGVAAKKKQYVDPMKVKATIKSNRLTLKGTGASRVGMGRDGTRQERSGKDGPGRDAKCTISAESSGLNFKNDGPQDGPRDDDGDVSAMGVKKAHVAAPTPA